MANGGQITFGVDFKANTQGLDPAIQKFNQMNTQIEKLSKIGKTDFAKMNPDMTNINSEFGKVRDTLKKVKTAYKDAFNPALGTLNVQKLNESLNTIGINKIKKDFDTLGAAGTKAFRDLASDSLTTNLRLKDTQTILDKLGNTLINTIKWNISSSVVNNFTNSIQQAWGYAKHLDSSLNDIRIVTGKSADEMDRFAKQANNAAKRLGSSTTDYTEAALIYYQQGLSDKETAARAETTIKAANVTGQSGEAVSEQLTAVWNGYKVSAEEAELYIDKLAAVAATTASDLEELSTGMSKVASAAAIMGVDIDQLNAQLATIVSVTREAPESIGTALKTVYARMSDITAGLDGEVSLDEYTQQMADMGINVLDANGNLRDMGDIIEEIGGKWQSMSREQQTSLAQTIAGTRQYSRMMSLFDNWDMYTKALNTSADAAGTLNEQNEIYLESTEAHIQELRTSLEGLYDSLINTDSINVLIDLFSTLVNGVEQFTDAIGGGGSALLLLGSLFTKVFNKNIVQNIAPLVQNLRDVKQNELAREAEVKNTKNWAQSEGMDDAVVNALVKRKQEMQQYYDIMSTEEQQAANDTIKRIALIEQESEEYKQTTLEKIQALSKLNQAYSADKDGESSNKRDIEKILNKAQQDVINNEGIDIAKTNLEKISHLLDTVQKLNAEVDNLQNNIGKTSDGLDIKFKRTGEGAIKTNSQIQQLKDREKQAKLKIEELNKKNKELEKQEKKATGADKEKISQDKVKSDKELATARKKLETITTQLKQSEKDLSDAQKRGSQAIEKKKKEIQDLGIKFEGSEQKVTEMVASLDKMNDSLKSNDLTQYDNELKKLKTTLASLPEDMNKLAEGINVTDLSGHAENVRYYQGMVAGEEQNLNKEDLDINKKIQDITNYASAIMSIGAAWMSISNIQEIWADDSSSAVEKVGSTIMSLIPAVMSAVEVFSLLKGTRITDTVWTWAQTTAQTALAAAIGITIPPALILAGALLGIVAVAGGLIFAFKEIQKASPEGKLKRAEEAAKESAEALEEAKQKAEDLKNAFNDYNSIVDKLKSCKAGTQEWKDALQEANEQALEMLDTFPELQKYMSRDANGMLIFDEEGVQAYQDKLDEQARVKKYASYQANLEVEDAQNKVAKTDLENELERNIGVTFSDALLNNIEDLANLSQEEYLAKSKEILKDTGMAESVLDSYTDTLLSNQQAIDDLANATQATADKMSLIGEQIAQNELGDSYGEDSAAVNKIAGEQYATEVDKIYKKVLDQTKDGINKASSKNDKEVKALWQRYSEATGTNYQLASNAVRGTDNNRSFAYIDESGETKTIAAETLASQIAAAEALSKMTGNAEEAAAALQTLQDKAGDTDIARGLTDFIATGSFGSMTQGDFEKLQTTSQNTTINGKTGTEAYLDSLIGDGEDGIISDETAQKYGYKTAEEMVKAFDTAVEGMDFESITENLLAAEREAFDNLNLAELTFDEQTAVADSLQKAYEFAGQEGLNYFTDVFNKVNANGEADEFASVLNSINWNTVDIDTLRTTLENAGVSTDFTTAELLTLIDTMGEAATSTESLVNSIAKINAVVKDLEMGDTISQEDYDTLGSELGTWAQSYFTMMLDGTYKLMGSAEDFQEAVQAYQMEQVQGQKAKIGEQYSDLAQWQGTWDTVSKQQYIGTGGQRDIDAIQQQIDFVNQFGGMENPTRTWRLALEDGTITQQQLEDINTAVLACEESYGQLDSQLAESSAEFQALDLAIAMSYTNLTDLKAALDSGEITGESYTQAAYQMDLEQDTDSLDTEEWDAYAEHLQEVAKDSDDLSDSLEDNEDAAKIVAKGIMKMNDAIETLSDNFDEWGDVLKKSSKSSEEYQEAMDQTRSTVADLLDISKDYVSEDFITEHLDDIAKAADGDAEAIDGLKASLSQDIMAQIILDNSEFITDAAAVQSQYESLVANMPDVEVGATLTGTDSFVAGLNELITSTGMTVDQVNALCDSLGFEAAYATEEVDTGGMVPVTTKKHVITDKGEEDGARYWTEKEYVSTSYEPVNGTNMAFAMDVATKGSSPSPKISGLTKKAGGSANNASSSNKGGGKSGGGGGGSKPKEPDKKDPIDDQIDRYHDINVEIQRLSTAYDRLGKVQEKLSGADLIKNLNEQLKVLEKQKDAYAAKIELARQEQAELQNSLGAGGVTFAEDGTISNYAAALQNQENQVNAIIANYNNMTAEEQEAYKKVVEKAQEDYEKFKEEIARYDELVNSEIPEMEDAIQEFIDQQVEIQVQKFNMSVEIELDLAEAERQWNEFKKTVIDGIDEDDILGNAGAALNNLNVYSDPTTGEGTVSATSDHVNDILNELALMDAGQESSIYGTDRAKAIEDLKTYSDTLMEEMMNFEGEVEEIRQMYLDLIDETNEEIDKQIENYEFVTSLIEHDLNLIEKIKGEDAYAEMATYYDKQAENYKSQLEFQRQEVNLWKERMDAAKSAGNEDAYEKFKENWMEAVEQLNSTTDAALDNLMSKYENAVNKIFDDLNNKVTNGMGLDYVAEEWELSNQAAERYLDTVNEAFAIDSLRNKYQTAIDESSSLTTQQKLNDLMKEEIEALEKKDKLTQYDVDRANMKYDIALKQLALEEAQQNKSQMRLRRDSQGNYTYQFVSDEDQMAQAQQELAEAQNSLYNFDKERYQANLDEMLSTYTEFTERMAEASLIIDDEERLARQAMLREKYGEIINGIVADNETVKLNLQDSAFTELAGIYDVNTENYKNMTQEQKDLVMSDLIPAWQEGAQAMVNAFSGPGGFEETVSSTFDELDLVTQDYVNGLDAIGEAAGVNFDDVINGIDDTIDTMDGIIDGNDDIISQYDEQLDQMDDILDKLDDMIEKYKSIKTEAIAASEAAYKYQKEEAERQAAEAAKKAAEEEAKKQAANSSSKNNGTTTSTTSSSNTTNGGSPNSPGSPSNVSTPKYRVIAAGIGEIWSYDTRGQAESAITANKGKYKGKSLSIAYYKTGGYTGEWAGGSEEKNGKLAMLHQKELVLNEQDTSNVLTAIQILRGMSGVLETMTGRLSSLDGGFSMPTGSMGEIIQEIIINAEFPDATDRNEIQAAFENLVGRASQYAFNTEK